MAFDVHSNFGYSTITAAPDPSTSGTTLVVSTATFADFPDPGTIGYNVVVWPAGTIPLSSNSEILRVVTKGTNGTVEVTREQESTSARDITVGDQCGVAITKKVITDIETAVPTQATGAEVNTGTEDAKIVTPKALADSDYKKNPMTAAGDIIYGGASGAPTRLAKGTASQVLTMDAGATAPEWKDAAAGLTKAAGSDITTGTDDAKYVTSKAIADAMTYKLDTPWTSYTPSLTNVTIGSGTITGAYIKIGKFITARIHFKYNSSTISGLIGFSLPITAAAEQTGQPYLALILDAGSAYMGGVGRLGSTTRIDILALNSGGSYSSHTDTSASVPMTWANNDEIYICFTYEAA